MRTFLPIKGPGGRYLTMREKIALLVLGISLALCVLTLLAGDRAYEAGQDFNPISSFAAALARTFGGGIIALYALIIVWSGLIYFKGENAVRVGPLPGRVFAALCVTIGVSGLLGIPGLVTAGALGAKVGGAIGNTFGAPLGFPVLILLLMLGAHLAGQGALSAIREPALAGAVGGGYGGAGALGGLGHEPASGRLPEQTPMPDDGDPSADERTFAVTQAMEEIERSKGVTIVDVGEPAEDPPPPHAGIDRPSIGEEVESAPEPEDDTEEADVRRGLLEISDALAGAAPEPADVADADDGCIDVEEYREQHDDGPPNDEETADEETDEAGDGDVAGAPEGGLLAGLTAAPAAAEDPADAGEDVYDEETYAHDDETDELAPPPEEVREDAGYDDEGYEDGDEEEAEYEEDEDEADEEAEYDDEEEEAEAPLVAGIDDDSGGELEEDAERPGSGADGQADDGEDEREPASDTPAASDEEQDGDDPYAKGGLLRRIGADPAPEDEEAPFTAFDWRGRPLE